MRCARFAPPGFTREVRCDCCGLRETLAHVLQVCPRSKAERQRRHDAIVQLITHKLDKTKFNVLTEQRVDLPRGRGSYQQPDLLITDRQSKTTMVVDVTIVADNERLSDAVNSKIQKYNHLELVRRVKMMTGAGNVEFSAVVLNWRGCLASESIKLLSGLGLTRRTLQLIVVKVLEGNVRTYRAWNRSTFRELTDIQELENMLIDDEDRRN